MDVLKIAIPHQMMVYYQSSHERLKNKAVMDIEK